MILSYIKGGGIFRRIQLKYTVIGNPVVVDNNYNCDVNGSLGEVIFTTLYFSQEDCNVTKVVVPRLMIYFT